MFHPKNEHGIAQRLQSDPDLLSELYAEAEARAGALDSEVVGAAPLDPAKMPYLASMGICVFKRSVLCDIVNEDAALADFGRDIIPWALSTGAPARCASCMRCHD